MLLKSLKNTAEKYGFILSDAKFIPEGVGSNGKEHGDLYLFTILEYGATETTTLFTTKDFFDEINAAIVELEYLTPVVVTGDVVGNKFTATMVEKWELE